MWSEPGNDSQISARKIAFLHTIPLHDAPVLPSVMVDAYTSLHRPILCGYLRKRTWPAV